MQRDKNDNSHDAEELNGRLGRLERKNCPWRRADRSVMAQMRIFEYPRQMHEAVCPIKIGIVNQQAKEETDGQVIQRVLANIAINAGMAGLVEFEQHGRH